EGPATTVSVGQLDQEQAEQVLARLKPEEFHSHDRWLKLMMAIHHATEGDARQEFIDWSIADPNYADQAEQIGRRWDSLHADSNMARITIGTLRHFLAEAKALDVLPPDQDAAAKDF
ncbi:MAG TPA: PriCT-2 domain-containing protein, partial [Rugosimonospora sp.]|nr:PriCT-2 domain-containing protein [Rugosimonospora sp.]